MIRWLTTVFGVLVCGSISLAGPKVSIVTGPKAPAVERIAADELTAIFKTLFDSESDPKGTPVLIGSPATNPAIKAAVGDDWPKLGERGYVLRSTTINGSPALILGGNTPAAALWAVGELGQRFGVRTFLHGDVFPHPKPEFQLTGIDVVAEAPKLPAWKIADDSPVTYAGWGLDDRKLLLRQLAKLKFDRVIISPSSAPMPTFRVDGDTAGRRAFRGMKVFENPDLAGKPADARLKLNEATAEAARELGMHAEVSGNQPDTYVVPGVLPRLPMLPREGVVNGRLPGEFSLSLLLLTQGKSPTALAGLLAPIYGETAPERIAKGFAQIAAAGKLIADKDPKFDTLSPDMVSRYASSTEPPPAWWKEAAGLYTEAMNEMYRGIRASYNDPARLPLLYHAKRCEFALHYLTAIEAARLATIAKSKGEKDAQLEQLEKATESMYNALSALGEVARDPSDRGVLAALNEYVYRPLKTELLAAEDAGK